MLSAIKMQNTFYCDKQYVVTSWCITIPPLSEYFVEPPAITAAITGVFAIYSVFVFKVCLNELWSMSSSCC